MNEQLKIMNKKIKLLNEVMEINGLFDKDKSHYPTQRNATMAFQNIVKEQTKMMFVFAEKEIMSIATFCRDMFFNQPVQVKRKVVNDRLINIWIVEPKTGHICPLKTQVFLKKVEKIKVKEKRKPQQLGLTLRQEND